MALEHKIGLGSCEDKNRLRWTLIEYTSEASSDSLNAFFERKLDYWKSTVRLIPVCALRTLIRGLYRFLCVLIRSNIIGFREFLDNRVWSCYVSATFRLIDERTAQENCKFVFGGTQSCWTVAR